MLRFECNHRNLLLLTVAALFGLGAMTDDEAQGAVASNAYECAPVGADILREGGSAADAAIAMMICEEVACPESAGIGGGFLATIYDREKGTVEVLDAREVAANGAREDMFVGNGEAAVHGGLAIATPGALKGYWVMHQRHGKLPWKRLIEPSIDLCYRGHIVNPYMADAMQEIREEILNTTSLREIFVDPETGDLFKEGDIIKRPDFARTLEVIAVEGADALYSKNGSLLPILLNDLKTFGSIITEQDFLSYEPRWLPPVSTELRNGNAVYSAALPGGGTILMHMLNVLDGYDDLDPADPLTWHRVIETFKHAYGVRTRLGDPPFVPGIEELIRNLTSKDYADYIRAKIDDNRTYTSYEFYGADFANPEDLGTAHVSALAPNGDAVAATGTINDYFGAQLRSPSTGIIPNGEMDDFSTPGVINIYGVPASPANFIAPKKRPLSSMSPAIVIDGAGDVRLIAGGAGGTRITTATLQLILRHAFFGEDLRAAMDGPRVHHQLAPMWIEYEDAVDANIVEQLKARGHAVKKVRRVATETAVARERDGRVSAAFDPRRPGSAEVVEG
ncbi:hypothetical protein pipiens_013679 [Culex pipiens pipiens]|uniref:Gamma-glutamyltransferase n=1 Tax=Culex pipiens pipiens TaxID=38569 RepID=A0ABD1CXH5_CULPP